MTKLQHILKSGSFQNSEKFSKGGKVFFSFFKIMLFQFERSFECNVRILECIKNKNSFNVTHSWWMEAIGNVKVLGWEQMVGGLGETYGSW